MVVRIHPGQSFHPPTVPLHPLLLALVLLPAAAPGSGQERGVSGPQAAPAGVAALVPTSSGAPLVAAPQEVALRPDSTDLVRAARNAQARLERVRRRTAPRTYGSWGGRCDDIVGRICLRLEQVGDWWPRPESEAVTAARDELLRALETAGEAHPGDAWVLGQRVVYLVEAGRPAQALGLARGCGPRDPAWCAGLEGYVLHVTHRYPEAEAAFRRALESLDPEERRRWESPRDLMDRDGRELLDDAGEEEWRELVHRFWSFSDPLLLAEGNDRWTEHLSRHVVARTREEAENPYNLNWGDDLAEAVIRYGWEEGWEQIEPGASVGRLVTYAVGHQHPESRSYAAPGAALEDLPETGWEDFNPGSRYLPRSGYAPAYAPVILPAEAEVYRVPRGDSLVLVAAVPLPTDTSYHRAHDHLPLPVPAPFQRRRGEVGLFALDGEGRVVAEARAPLAGGVVRVAVPPGEYLLSAEAWAADSARAGRHREGVRWDGLPPDLPTASDLFLLRAGADAASLEEALDHLLVGALAPGQSFRVAWELNGFGWERETLEYELQVQEDGGGFFRSAGRFLGLVGDGEVTALSWSEPGPEAPGPFFRAADLSLPEGLDSGEYRIRLRIEAQGREPMVLERILRIR